MQRNLNINQKRSFPKKIHSLKKNSKKYKKTAKLIFKGFNRPRQNRLRLLRRDFTARVRLQKVSLPTTVLLLSKSGIASLALPYRSKLTSSVRRGVSLRGLAAKFLNRGLPRTRHLHYKNRQRARTLTYTPITRLKRMRDALREIAVCINAMRKLSSRRSRALSNYILRLRRVQLRSYRAVTARPRPRTTARGRRRLHRGYRRRHYKRWRRVVNARRRGKLTTRYFGNSPRRYRLKTRTSRQMQVPSVRRKLWQLQFAQVPTARNTRLRRRAAIMALGARTRRANSHALHGPYWRRRSRGGWLYAGLFGKLRRRAGRRDKLLIKRARLRYGQRSSLVQETRRALALLNAIYYQKQLVAKNTAALRLAPRTQQFGLRYTLRTYLLNKFKRRAFNRVAPRSIKRSTRMDFQHNIYHNSSIAAPRLLAAPHRSNKRKVRKLIDFAHGTFSADKPLKHEIDRRFEDTRTQQKLLFQKLLSSSLLTATPKYRNRSTSTTSLLLKNRYIRNSLLLNCTGSPIKKAIFETKSTDALVYSQPSLPLTPTVTRFGYKRPQKQYHTGWLTFLRKRLERQGSYPLGSSATHARQLKELRFYLSHPRLRLPRTTMTRSRRRRGGHVLHAGNFLKHPKTFVGKKQQLLPPVTAYTYLQFNYKLGHLPGATSLLHRQQFADKHPRFWKRPPTRANLKPLHALRLRELRRSRYKTLRIRRPLRLRLRTPSASICDKAYTSNGESPVNSLPEQCFSVRDSHAKQLLAIEKNTRRTRAHLHGVLSRTTATVAVHKNINFGFQQKTAGLWYLRSAQAALTAERALSAWSPLFRAKTRRWLQPRLDGRPLPRKALGFKASRERRLANARRLDRNLPQIKYIDYEATKLQFHLGSAGAGGYSRLRRVLRLHSDHKRWWQPVRRAVPFAHPFSRRTLSAKYFYKQAFNSAVIPERHSLNNNIIGARGKLMSMKFPGRTIPWRNFRYPRPRKGVTPRTLRRWTYKIVPGQVGYAGAATHTLVLKRPIRGQHNLSSFASGYAVWNNRRWASLDNDSSREVVSRQFVAALQSVPPSVWYALTASTNANSTAAAVRHMVLYRFRAWLAAQDNTLTTESATTFLTSLILAAANFAHSNSAQVASALRAAAFTRRTKLKHNRFFTLSELPKISSASKGIDTLTSRDNSVAHKYWLHGAEQLLRLSRWSYSPMDRSRYLVNVSSTVFRNRTRFPAASRQRRSYESVLQAFTRKISSPRLRRPANLRFRRAHPKVSGDFRQNVIISYASSGVSRRRRLARKLSQVAYLSAPWREILNYRKHEAILTKAFTHTASKRRFMSLPLKVTLSQLRQQAAAANLLQKIPTYATRACILRRALRRRRAERLIFDLRRAVLHRRIPKDLAPSPRKLRRAIRKQRARRSRRQRKHVWHLTQPQTSWSLNRLDAVGLRPENMSPSVSNMLPSGELFYIKSSSFRYERRAFYGFDIQTLARHRRRLRRKPHRDSSKRYRRYGKRRRLGMRAAMRKIRHWSETKGSRGIGSYTLARRAYFARKFLRNRTLAFAGLRSQSKIGFISRRLATFTEKTNTINNIYAHAPFIATNAPIAASTLISTSSLVRRHRVRRLSRASRLSRLKYRNTNRGVRAVIKKHKTLTPRNGQKNYLHVLPEISTISFQKPALYVVKSDTVKRNEALADISLREERYKITAQYLESLTTYIPEFINHMLSKKIINSGLKISYNLAQHLIRNTYWSLRVYLNVDPFDTRFSLRDKKPSARLRLLEELTELSLTQNTEQPQRAQLRYRFQPGRVLLAANTKRFRSDWLRAFFPAKHALYQEDSNDYGLFLFKTRDIRRLRLTGYSLSTWKTAPVLVSQESRARQLFTRKYSRVNSRFETAMQTTRRTPSTECAPLNIRNHVQSFFRREFSTLVHREVFMSSARVYRQKRFVAFAEKQRTVSPVAVIQFRSRRIPQTESLGVASYLPATLSATSSSLDSRFTRAKSPRSRQYLVRGLSNRYAGTLSGKFYHMLKHKQAWLASHDNGKKWTRSYRRKFYNISDYVSGVVPKAYVLLDYSRRLQNLRRFYGHTYGTRACKQLSRLYIMRKAPNDLKHRTGRKIASRAPILRRAASRKFARRFGLQFRVTGGVRPRNATSRSTNVLFNSLPVVLSKSVFYTDAAVLVKKKHKLLRKRAQRNGLRSPKVWSVFSGAPKISAKFQLKSPRSGTSQLDLAFSTNAYTVQEKTANSTKFFQNEAARQLMRSKSLGVTCGMFSRVRKNVPFDLHRNRLWDRLTLRWRKKYRTSRYWIRDTSHWLRDPWLSQIVACDMSLRPDIFGGELRSRQQQIGEYVPEVDDRGRDIPEAESPTRERHAFVKRPTPIDRGIEKTVEALKGPFRGLTQHRLQISKIARRKPVPAMWLANYEYRDVIREHKENKLKSSKQRAEEELVRVKAYWERKMKNLPEEKPKRAALKHPSNLWLPRVIWKEIARRVRKFEWRESDQVFYRKGFKNAFRFYNNERNTIPWLEPLMYTRATYSTRLHEFRRRQYPREQKKYKWLQRVRKSLYAVKRAKYLRFRNWRRLRRYNQKLHYSLFNLPDANASRRHFKKINRRSRPPVSGFVSSTTGLANRLDVVLLQLRVAPTIYWARIITDFGLVRINGKVTSASSQQLQPNDFIQLDWDRIARFQHFFKPHLNRREAYARKNRQAATTYPTNFSYHPGTRTFTYKHAPDESDLRRSNRIQSSHFRWFKLDSA